MAKRRPSGDGMVRLKKENQWEGRFNKNPVHGNKLADNIIIKIHGTLHLATEMAIEKNLIAKNPTEGTTVPKKKKKDLKVLNDSELDKLMQAKFEPKKGKMRKPGTGCISKINDHLYEGRYSPKDAYGKRMARNIYAPTREECEEKLAVLIKKMNAEIAEQKAKLKNP